MDKIRIGYFLEDIGQENFLVTLVERAATEKGIESTNLSHDVRNATGGRGKVLDELRRFLHDVSREQDRPFDLLIVSIDGNCRGYVEKRNEIQAHVAHTSYRGSVAHAVPDPHIERWYLADPEALRRVFGGGVNVNVPAYKCERMRYKLALRDTMQQAGISAPLGGAEYGSDIAACLNFYAIGKVDPGFKHFVDEIWEGLAHLH